MIIKRVCRLIVISRNPVGHTHDDIDGLFGVSKKKVSGKRPIHTWDEWSDVLQSAFTQEKLKVEVFDVFIIPNIQSLFEGACKHVGKFAKGEF